ncbi:LytR/AlgR family response regulator transcription factor [Aquimarina spongiae]|uniref:Two component transcriptional regulator, LytTR family n=1 Tax=Aquimarina spongiae TaxID=570521 RepID=A0A1M6G5K1_9FLAO|nr:LytTR family DNA-binding domain-containing protein [Aquimarina spongiae]SHJ05222.1 two component transcriptional regulator, LytTR family [Aquimarina spongiae]
MNTKVSCIIVDDEPTARDIIKDHLSKIDRIEIIAICANAMDAFSCINEQAVDLIFLDIHMPGISGISFARSINKNIKIIFTTAYREYAIDGFDLHAVDYLLKPISFERLLKSLNNYFEVYQQPTKNIQKNSLHTDYIFVRSDRRMKRIDFSDILYIESYSDYLKIHCTSGVITTRETISNMQSKLPTKDFIRIHRSFVVAISKIDSFSNEEVVVGNKSLPISRNYKTEVLKTLEQL